MTKGELIIACASGQLSVCESPAGSNKTKYGVWYGMNGVAWCAIFVSWVYNTAGLPLPHIDSDKGYHYCPSAFNYFKKNNLLVTEPKPGDIVLFDWNGDGKFDHTGIFVKMNKDGKTFQSIEGNTAVGDDSNGGTVMERTRNLSVAKFARVLKED